MSIFLNARLAVFEDIWRLLMRFKKNYLRDFVQIAKKISFLIFLYKNRLADLYKSEEEYKKFDEKQIFNKKTYKFYWKKILFIVKFYEKEWF